MTGRKFLLHDGEGTLKQRLCFLVSSLVAAEFCQCAQSESYISMIFAERILLDLKGAMEQRFGLFIPALQPIKSSDVIQTNSYSRMFFSKCLFSYSE